MLIPAIITQLLLAMNELLSPPSRLPINSPKNPFTRPFNPQFSPSDRFANFHDPHTSPSLPINSYSPSGHKPILTENLNLADQPSFARNFKGRLYGAIQSQEDAKQLKQQKYRQQLMMQAEQDRRRKKQEKDKADAEDFKLEQQFYANIGIEAQKKGLKKEEPSYFMMRTAKGGLGKQNSLSNSRAQAARQNSFVEEEEKKNIAAAEFSKKDNLKRTLYQHPTIMKRGGYHNQSSLDPQTSNPQQNVEEPHPPSPRIQRKRLSQSLKPRQGELQAELQYEQQRIHQIMMFQEHMLKKLDYFKKDVIVASRSLHLDEELDKVRLKLRAKPLNMQKIYHLNPREGVDNVVEDTSFYHLPLISPRSKAFEGSREVKKRRDKERHFQELRSQESQMLNSEEGKEVVRLEDKRKVAFNDKNIVNQGSENEEAFQSER